MSSTIEPLQQTALMQRLQSLDQPVLYGKLISLRQEISEWLGYIPATFPHYTRHSVTHSDEIVRQISALMFEDRDWRRPILELSGAEIYCVVAASYLHDAGMVTSERDKSEILGSSDWIAWSTSGGGKRRWNEIQQLRSLASLDNTHRHFIADLQTRFLVAEYVRRQHHIRAASFLEESYSLFTARYFEDPIMLRSVADICIGHGLEWRELQNPERYPLRRDTSNGPLNVRLLSILLRLGDLLDLSYDRACPLLLNASAPLPYDSLANWSQYRRIIHRLTDPSRIEIIAECANQDEHRLLRDWCQWIQDETEHAAVLIQGTGRHGGWRPPLARLSEPDATIAIRPRVDASYLPVDWTFVLDEDTILERLIVDAYQGHFDAIRELVQNAADANRCVLARALHARGITYTGWVDEAEKEIADSLPIVITISRTNRENKLSGEIETKTVVTVEDSGIGMDADIIQHYLLQIGRSYYSSRDFQRDFDFIPTSRFGIGFMSVFAISDSVDVDTFKPSPGGRPLKLRLTGPKSYVLLDKGSRTAEGTSVSLEFRESVSVETLTHAIDSWCRRLEFPVYVSAPESNYQKAITAELPAEEIVLDTNVANYPRARRRVIPIRTSTARGEAYIWELRDKKGLWRWDATSTSLRAIIDEANPLKQSSFQQPRESLCLHGIEVPIYTSAFDSSLRLRLDCRMPRSEQRIGLGRNSLNGDEYGDYPFVGAEVDEVLAATWAKHCDDLEVGWRYRHDTAYALGLPYRIVKDLPATLRAFDASGNLLSLSIRDVIDSTNLAVFTPAGEDRAKPTTDVNLRSLLPEVGADTIFIAASDIYDWHYKTYDAIFSWRRLFTRISYHDDSIFLTFGLAADRRRRRFGDQALLAKLDFEPDDVFMRIFHGNHRWSLGCVVINFRNPLVQVLHETLSEAWNVGETRHLSANPGIVSGYTDDFSRIIEALMKCYGHEGYKESQVRSVFEAAAKLESTTSLALDRLFCDQRFGGQLIVNFRRGN